MAVDLIRYDLLAQDALRGVVRKVLVDIAARGLPGEHHLYVAFDTRAPGVDISERLRTKYPGEMTIVLQHQFWDLVVAEDHFEVGVSFNGIPERLSVPFTAIKGFFDPSVQFGLQFENAAEPKVVPEKDLAQDTEATVPQRVAPERPAGRGLRGAASEPEETRPQTRGSVPASRKKAAPAAVEKTSAADKAEGAEVVSLDKFRKK